MTVAAQNAVGIDMALSTMSIGETAVVRVGKKFGFSDRLRPESVPADTDLEYRLCLVACDTEVNMFEVRFLNRKHSPEHSGWVEQHSKIRLVSNHVMPGHYLLLIMDFSNAAKI